jgi:hypothetical protein
VAVHGAFRMYVWRDRMEDINCILKAYTEAWNSAFETKSDVHIREYMSKSFRGVWGHSGIEEPEQYGFDYDIVRSSVAL